MRCILCENLSFAIICRKCQDTFLQPSFYKRELSKDFFVYSFYSYKDMKELLNTKYDFYGDKIFNIMGKIAFKKFGINFTFNKRVFAVPVDDHARHHFSQSAILARWLKSEFIKPIYSTLRATNIIKYAGKDLNFRIKNKRNFKYSGLKNIDIILVDDLVTSGATLLEAKNNLEKHNCNILFAVTLCDALN